VNTVTAAVITLTGRIVARLMQAVVVFTRDIVIVMRWIMLGALRDCLNRLPDDRKAKVITGKRFAAAYTAFDCNLTFPRKPEEDKLSWIDRQAKRHSSQRTIAVTLRYPQSC
jgi:hypothetical protein